MCIVHQQCWALLLNTVCNWSLFYFSWLSTSGVRADVKCSLWPSWTTCTTSFLKLVCTAMIKRLLFTFVSEVSFEYGWSNMVIYCFCVGILAVGVLYIYADVLCTFIILQVNWLSYAWSCMPVLFRCIRLSKDGRHHGSHMQTAHMTLLFPHRFSICKQISCQPITRESGRANAEAMWNAIANEYFFVNESSGKAAETEETLHWHDLKQRTRTKNTDEVTRRLPNLKMLLKLRLMRNHWPCWERIKTLPNTEI